MNWTRPRGDEARADQYIGRLRGLSLTAQMAANESDDAARALDPVVASINGAVERAQEIHGDAANRHRERNGLPPLEEGAPMMAGESRLGREAGAGEPVAGEPAVSEPVAGEPAAGEPVSPEPGTARRRRPSMSDLLAQDDAAPRDGDPAAPPSAALQQAEMTRRAEAAASRVLGDDPPAPAAGPDPMDDDDARRRRRQEQQTLQNPADLLNQGPPDPTTPADPDPIDPDPTGGDPARDPAADIEPDESEPGSGGRRGRLYVDSPGQATMPLRDALVDAREGADAEADDAIDNVLSAVNRVAVPRVPAAERPAAIIRQLEEVRGAVDREVENNPAVADRLDGVVDAIDDVQADLADYADYDEDELERARGRRDPAPTPAAADIGAGLVAAGALAGAASAGPAAVGEVAAPAGPDGFAGRRQRFLDRMQNAADAAADEVADDYGEDSEQYQEVSRIRERLDRLAENPDAIADGDDLAAEAQRVVTELDPYAEDAGALGDLYQEALQLSEETASGSPAPAPSQPTGRATGSRTLDDVISDEPTATVPVAATGAASGADLSDAVVGEGDPPARRRRPRISELLEQDDGDGVAPSETVRRPSLEQDDRVQSMLDRVFGAQSERGPDGGRISGDEEVTRALGVSDEARDRVIARRQETDPDFDQEDANFHYLYGLVRRIDEGRSEDEIAEEFGISRERVADFVDRQPRAIDTGRQLIREGQSDPELDNEFRAARDSVGQEPADRDPMDRDPIEQEPADRDPGPAVRDSDAPDPAAPDPAAPESMDGDPDDAPTTETDAEAAVRRIRSGEDRDDALEGAAVVAVSALSLRPRQEAYVNRRMRESARGFGADLGEEPRVNAAVLPDGTAVLYTEVDGQTLVTELPQTTFTRPIVRAASARAGEPAAADRQPVDGEPLAGEPRDSEPLAGEPSDSEPAAPAREPEPGSPEDQARRAEAMIERRLAGESEPRDGEPRDGEPPAGEPRDGEPPASEPRDGEPPLEIDGQEVDTGPGRAQEALDRIRAGVPAGRALDDAETASLEDALQSPRQRNYFAVRLERAAAQTNRPLQGDYEISAAVFDDDTVLVYAEQDGRAVAIPLTQQDALTDTVDRVRDHVRANPAVRPAGSPDTDHNDISDNVLQPVEEVGQPTAHDVSELVAAQRAEIRAAVDRVDDDRASVDERGMLLARDVHTRLDALRVPHPDDVETPEELNSASADYLEDLRSLRDEVRARLVAEPALERQHVGELADTLDRAVDAAEEQMGERSVRHAGEAAEDLTVGSPSPRDSAADNLRAFARQQRDARAGRDAGDPAPDPVDPAAPADPPETAPAVVATEQGQVAAGDAPSTQAARQPRIADVRAARETVHDSVEDALSSALDDESLDPSHRDTLRSLQRDLPAVASDEGQARNNAHNVRLLSAELRHQREQLGPEAAEASHPLNRVHQALSEAEEFVDESFPNLPPTTALAAAPTRAPDGTPLAGTGAGAGVGPTGAVAGPVARAGDAARARLLANTLTTRRIEAVRPDIGAELITAVHEAFPEDGASSVELETRNTLMRHARAVQAGGDPSLPNADAARVLNRQLSTFNRAAQTAGIRNPDLQERVDVVQESLQGVYSTLSRPSDLDTLVERQETAALVHARRASGGQRRTPGAGRRPPPGGRRPTGDRNPAHRPHHRRPGPTGPRGPARHPRLPHPHQLAPRGPGRRGHGHRPAHGRGHLPRRPVPGVGPAGPAPSQLPRPAVGAGRPQRPWGGRGRNRGTLPPCLPRRQPGLPALCPAHRGRTRPRRPHRGHRGPAHRTGRRRRLRPRPEPPALGHQPQLPETLPLLRELSDHQQQIEARQRPFITPGDLPAVPTRRRDQGSLLEQRQRRLSAEASGEPGALAVTPQENEALRARAWPSWDRTRRRRLPTLNP